MLIKICGLKNKENIRQIIQLGANLIGLIHHEASDRHLSFREIEALSEDNIIRNKAIVVSVNQKIDFFKNLAKLGVLNFQLHGNETLDLIAEIKNTINGAWIYKAISIDIPEHNQLLRNSKGLIDYFIFDSSECKNGKTKFGGTGKKFDWKKLAGITKEIDTSFLLSGGIGPEDHALILKEYDKQILLAGVDLNSRFEISPGFKSISKIETFIKSIR